MPDEPKVSTFRRATLTPGPSERTIRVSCEQFILLLDAFAECANSLQHKLILLDDLYALLQRADEDGTRKVLTQSKQQEVGADAR